LLLYSDGLVERRRESLSVGLRRLAEYAVAVGDGPGWPDELVRRMIVGAGDDDLALLAVAYAPEFRATLPASPERLAGLRRQLREWLAAVGVDGEAAADILLACGEAAANAVEHAFPDGPGQLSVELQLAAGRELTVRVADTGRWRRVPAPGDRGRGLPLMRAVMDTVRVEPGEGGTVVTMRRRLAGPA
jgi:anti-sigma regulatory factor (Ser/Thr protein kinase)